MKLTILVALFVGSSSLAWDQETGLQQLLSGKDFVLSMKIKDLGSEWKHVNIAPIGGQQGGMGDMMSQLMQAGAMSEMGKKGGGGGPSDAAGAMLGMSLLGGVFGGGSETKLPAYYTKGQTISLGGETFLVAYQYRAEKPNIMKMAMESEKQGAKEPDLGKLAEIGKMTAESTIELNLVNMKSIGSLTGIRPFDLNREIAESQPAGGLMDLMALGAAKDKSSATTASPATIKKTTPAKKPGK